MEKHRLPEHLLVSPTHLCPPFVKLTLTRTGRQNACRLLLPGHDGFDGCFDPATRTSPHPKRAASRHRLIRPFQSGIIRVRKSEASQGQRSRSLGNFGSSCTYFAICNLPQSRTTRHQFCRSHYVPSHLYNCILRQAWSSDATGLLLPCEGYTCHLSHRQLSKSWHNLPSYTSS